MAWEPWDNDRWYPPSRPLPAKGGIKARSKRGTFGESWWAARWISVLESFDIGGRLQRGRSYARQGQVLSIDVGKGLVRAEVQGSRPRPYSVTVKIRPLQPSEWKRLAAALSRQALFAAKLLGGEMPRDIEQAFADAGLALFPEKARELATACSCPDWSNPCKHIAAVYYLLGEEFDRDPFLLFRLRGLDRDELMRLLRQEPTPSSGRKTSNRSKTAGDGPTIEQPSASPLASDAAGFWREPTLPDGFFGNVERPPVAGALVRRLGRFPFWRGETELADSTEAVYARASERALALFVGDSD
jgi:uncharacterized Zn finger protein